MGFFAKVAGMFGSGEKSEPSYPSEEYKGLIITPKPLPDQGQYRIVAVIEKPTTESEEAKQHQFIRSDTVASADSAVELTMLKCKTLIDQMGDKIFDK
ncbi:HlyU family transcriptional regulator [Psychromonas sp. KJ10-10]|uniref:HlyU family transcriptional regulator n=1 Tax=Psychromonas sp. KJ10-10 TaxID=3391823 RepID=UPI0039B6D764